MSKYVEAMRATDEVPSEWEGVRFTTIDADGERVVYPGIQRYTGRFGGIAVAKVEDGVEVWDLESPGAVVSVAAYYRDRGEAPRISVWRADSW